MEQERRGGEGLPLGDDCYYVRFTEGMHLRQEDIYHLWAQGRVAVHLTESGVPLEGSARRGLDPKDYPIYERSTVSALLRLSRDGGYVWSESHSGQKVKVGVVRPDTPIESFEARWEDYLPHKYKAKAGTKTVLRTLQMERIRSVWLEKETMLRA